MCCSSSSSSLSRLGVAVGLLSLVTLVTAFVSNVWVFTREPVTLPPPNAHFLTTITFRVGFWRACPSVKKLNLTGHMPSPACQLIKYSPWDELYSADLGVLWAPLEFTPTFVSKMRCAMPFAGVSLVLTLLASMFALMGHCTDDHKTLVACGLYTLAGLTLASGLVVFVSVLSATYLERPHTHTSSQFFTFHYQYGWSFFTAGAAFILAEVAALLSMTSYLKRFPTVEDMVRAMVPGADRRLQEHQICKEYLVEHTGSVFDPGLIQKVNVLNTNEKEGCEGPLLTKKTPPDICSTNVIQEDDRFQITATTVPIRLMHKKLPKRTFDRKPREFKLPNNNVQRYATISSCTAVRKGIMVISDGNQTPSSTRSHSPSAAVENSSPSSLSGQNIKSLPRTRKHLIPSGSYTLASSKNMTLPGYCSGSAGCQTIIIHSHEEIV